MRVIARDKDTGRIFIADSAFPNGQMWFPERPKHASLEGYAEAQFVKMDEFYKAPAKVRKKKK